MRLQGLLACFLAAALITAPQSAWARVQIKVLSSRPDMVSGGDALIQVTAPKARRLSAIVLRLNGKDVTSQIWPTAAGVFTGVVSGMRKGANFLSVSARGGGGDSISIRNYPLSGPILSGPHLAPYECRTVESGLGEPLDKDCSAKTRIDYFYRAADRTFKPLLDPGARRPDDLATATTIDGRVVPYIVRVESGTINRSIYRIAILDDPPGAASAHWTPGAGWNRRLAVDFGGGAGAKYNQGADQASAALNDLYLSRGFAFMTATELVNDLHANGVLQGETLMMLKEHFIERYGVPKWTIGVGGSGGAIQQLVIAEMYPGLLDGLQPALAFPDSTLHTADCGLLVNYWAKADPHVWTPAKKEAVQGFAANTCDNWNRSFVPVDRAANKAGCGLHDSSLIYDPKTNPKGARCSIDAMRVNIYGRDPKTGFARRVADNVGLQYGLGALNAGAIGADDFLDLNERIGGEDADGNYVSTRSVGDPAAIRAAYASGLLDGGGGGLGAAPILQWRPYTDLRGDIHSRERDLAIRARLAKANGDAGNEVIWVGPPLALDAPAPGPDLAALSLDAMTAWLDALAADPAPLTHAKVVADRPAGAVDAYFSADGAKHAATADWNPNSEFNAAYPVHSAPRLVAGAPPANDVLKCQLKPVNLADYKVAFTPAQAARLKAIFPKGVCDFTKPGVDQVRLKGVYQRYGG